MITLGIHDGHGASACIMVDGELRALAAEERFTRLKNDNGYPLHAIDYCMRAMELDPQDIDHVAFASRQMNLWGVRLKALSRFSGEDWMMLENDYWKPLLYEGIDDKTPFKKLYEDKRFANEGHFYDFSDIDWRRAMNGGAELTHTLRLNAIKRHLSVLPEKVGAFDHHTCHAAYALFGSHLRDDGTMVYTLDGGGDGSTSTVFRFTGGGLTEVARSNAVDIARIYRNITLLLGMKLGEHEYKVMGLAPYAPKREFDKSYAVFDGMFTVCNDLIAYTHAKPTDLYHYFCEAFRGHRFDGISAATQQMCEVAVGQWILSTQRKYGARKLVFAGGAAMNVKLNMILAEHEDMDDFCVPPSPSDDTLCVGACYLAQAGDGQVGWRMLQPITNPYIGPAYERNEVLGAVRATGAAERYCVEDGVDAARISEWLAGGRVVARLAGRMEFGQRALGNRSILADARDVDTVDKINHQIKYRDFWMPFAPVIMDERASDYLDTSANVCRDYMMIAADTTPAGAKALAAAIHQGDKTARPQIVARRQNSGYYDIIKAFEARTGAGGLLNTSFNLHGEPIVCSPEDAISTFDRSGLDVLVMEDVALLRQGGDT